MSPVLYKCCTPEIYSVEILLMINAPFVMVRGFFYPKPAVYYAQSKVYSSLITFPFGNESSGFLDDVYNLAFSAIYRQVMCL